MNVGLSVGRCSCLSPAAVCSVIAAVCVFLSFGESRIIFIHLSSHHPLPAVWLLDVSHVIAVIFSDLCQWLSCLSSLLSSVRLSVFFDTRFYPWVGHQLSLQKAASDYIILALDQNKLFHYSFSVCVCVCVSVSLHSTHASSPCLVIICPLTHLSIRSSMNTSIYKYFQSSFTHSIILPVMCPLIVLFCPSFYSSLLPYFHLSIHPVFFSPSTCPLCLCLI